MISYEQYLKENESEVVHSTPSPDQQESMIMYVIEEMSNQLAKCNADNQENKLVIESLIVELEKYKERVKMLEERQKVDLNSREKLIDLQMNDMVLNRNAKFVAFQKEINTLKSTLSKNVKENESLMTTIDKAQRIKPMLYDASVITKKHDVISVIDTEETLILAEESRSKMMEKQNDPISKEKKVNICPINYAKLNKLFEYFIPQKEVSAEQAFWLPISNPISKQPIVQHTPVKTEVPRKLLKVSLVKKSFQKLKNHLAKFDKVGKVRTTASSRESFKDFDNGLHLELNEVKMVFNQIEAVVE
ncbi:hypothetical protein Tco_0695007 [Tanacetum coccineum]